MQQSIYLYYPKDSYCTADLLYSQGRQVNDLESTKVVTHNKGGQLGDVRQSSDHHQLTGALEKYIVVRPNELESSTTAHAICN